MLTIYKMFLRELIHEFKSIITYDCRDSYSGTQQNPTCKAGSAQNKKCTCRDCICSNFCLTNHLLNVSLKKTNRQFFHHHTAYDYRKESKRRWYTIARCLYATSQPFCPRMFTYPGLMLTNVAVYDKPN